MVVILTPLSNGVCIVSIIGSSKSWKCPHSSSNIVGAVEGGGGGEGGEESQWIELKEK